ncbi:MAG: universal stress protein [Rhodoferax sp.]
MGGADVAHAFTRLLLATQHTEFDVGAERLALQLAQRCGLPLSTVLPLLSNPEYEALAPEVARRAEQQTAQHMAQLRAQAQAMGVAIDLIVRRGEEAWIEIVEEARARASELIVLRRRGKAGFLANLRVGEMVSKVLAHAQCPVLFAPRQGTLWQRAVLVAVQPDAHGLQVLEVAAAVARAGGLPLHGVGVTNAEWTPSDYADWRTQAEARLAETGQTLFLQLRPGKPHEQILDAQRASGADLVVLGSRSAASAGRVRVGSVAQKVIGLSDTPTLAVGTVSSLRPTHPEGPL